MKKERAISTSELQRYIRYMAVALGDGGYVELEVAGLDGCLRITKREFKTKPNELTIEMSSGNHPRERLTSVAQELEKNHLGHQLTFTQKQKLPRKLKITVVTEGLHVPPSIIHAIGAISQAVELPQEGRQYVLTCWGPFKRGLPKEDGDVFPLTALYKFGYFVGRVMANVSELKEKKGKMTE